MKRSCGSTARLEHRCAHQPRQAGRALNDNRRSACMIGNEKPHKPADQNAMQTGVQSLVILMSRPTSIYAITIRLRERPCSACPDSSSRCVVDCQTFQAYLSIQRRNKQDAITWPPLGSTERIAFPLFSRCSSSIRNSRAARNQPRAPLPLNSLIPHNHIIAIVMPVYSCCSVGLETRILDSSMQQECTLTSSGLLPGRMMDASRMAGEMACMLQTAAEQTAAAQCTQDIGAKRHTFSKLMHCSPF